MFHDEPRVSIVISIVPAWTPDKRKSRTDTVKVFNDTSEFDKFALAILYVK